MFAITANVTVPFMVSLTGELFTDENPATGNAPSNTSSVILAGSASCSTTCLESDVAARFTTRGAPDQSSAAPGSFRNNAFAI